jgi:hypothetical protein
LGQFKFEVNLNLGRFKFGAKLITNPINISLRIPLGLFEWNQLGSQMFQS